MTILHHELKQKHGATMKNENNKVRFTARFSKDLAFKLHEIAFKKRISKNHIVNQALNNYFKGEKNV